MIYRYIITGWFFKDISRLKRINGKLGLEYPHTNVLGVGVLWFSSCVFERISESSSYLRCAKW